MISNKIAKIKDPCGICIVRAGCSKKCNDYNKFKIKVNRIESQKIKRYQKKFKTENMSGLDKGHFIIEKIEKDFKKMGISRYKFGKFRKNRSSLL